MRKLILVVHTSLDGFVAGVNGELSGFDAAEENLQFVADITDEADTLLMGRVSFQLLDKYWPTAKDQPAASPGTIKYSHWYSKAGKFMVSSTLSSHESGAKIIRDHMPAEIFQLKQQKGENILIFGSPQLFQSIVASGLIDEYWIFVNPVLFGKGIPLFLPSPARVQLTLKTTRQFKNGEIALHYAQ